MGMGKFDLLFCVINFHLYQFSESSEKLWKFEHIDFYPLVFIKSNFDVNISSMDISFIIISFESENG